MTITIFIILLNHYEKEITGPTRSACYVVDGSWSTRGRG